MRHLSLECRCEEWFLNFRRQIGKAKKGIEKSFLCPKCGIYLLNAALKRDLSILEGKYKGKCKCKGKCIGKWFLCPKCGIYLLNAALKRDFSISEGKYKGKMQMQRQMHRKMENFYALNAAFISWMPLWSVIFRFQNANTKAKCKCKGKCIGKWFLCPKCGIYLLNAAFEAYFLDFRMQIQRQMQRQRQMHTKMVFMP